MRKGTVDVQVDGKRRIYQVEDPLPAVLAWVTPYHRSGRRPWTGYPNSSTRSSHDASVTRHAGKPRRRLGFDDSAISPIQPIRCGRG